MPVTSVDVDLELIREAKRIFGVRTNKEAINLALAETVKKQRQLEAIERLSQIAVDIEAEKISYDRDLTHVG